ncbi:DUF1146 family protein [Virgibacillus sp. 179-BFC.A HS]|uniref:DUF1146 family protein n=1 Tax=Tigheibacillus jepli TaxID=3035914 RepID=A0ABU5CDZ5_9BACI|nr:DUF1146 family protein [Virgibacillus sp. 179-BFC.A HS]MDY0404572.1 DUF1146 family protein [Virgibacillus sp. 179-BFC.A HS]
MLSIGQTALVSMFSHLLFIYFTWRMMQGVNFDPIIRKGHPALGRLFLLFIAIVVGAGVSRFFLEFLQWSQQLRYMF